MVLFKFIYYVIVSACCFSSFAAANTVPCNVALGQKLSPMEALKALPSPHIATPKMLGSHPIFPGNYQVMQMRILQEQLDSLYDGLLALSSPEQVSDTLSQTYENIHAEFIELAGPEKAKKMKTLITDGDPNHDPFGDLDHEAGMVVNGKDTKQLIQRRLIKSLILQRFKQVENGGKFGELKENGDILVNQVTISSNQVVDGYQMVRGEIAQKIVDFNLEKEHQKAANDESYTPSPYGYKESATYVFTRSGSRNGARKIYQAGMDLLAETITTPMSQETQVDNFILSSYFLYQGLLINRGGDGTTRTFLALVSKVIFGDLQVIPQDIDIQAYVRDQPDFLRWMKKFYIHFD